MGLFGGVRGWFPRAPIRGESPVPLFWPEMNALRAPKWPDKKSIIPVRFSMALSTNQALAPTGKMRPHQEVLIGGFMRHKWMSNILPEGQFIFLQTITYLLLGVKSMIKSVPKWTPDEDKTLLEFLPMGSQSS